MEFRLSEDEEKIKRSFRELCDSAIKPAAATVDSSGAIPDSHWKALSEGGYLGFGFDPSFNGRGGSLSMWAVLGEELARTCASTFVSALASQLVGHIIQLHGTEAQKKKYLPAIASGALKGAIALDDSFDVLTTANRKSDGAMLNGAKPYVTNGPNCDVALVSAVTDSASEPKGMTLFLVDSDSVGFDRGVRISTMGIRGCAVSPLSFKYRRVSDENIVGDWNGADKILRSLMVLRRIWWSVYGVGIGQACVDEAISYATTHKVDGKPIAKRQEIHFKIAEMYMMVDTARQLLFKATWLFDKGQKADIVAAASKLLSTEMATSCAHKAVQILGTSGFVGGSTVERLYRDARLGELEGESSDALRAILAKDVLNEFAI